MTVAKPLGAVLLAGAIVVLALEAGERLPVPAFPSLVSTAGAVVGRPLTPVSVAGVSRRTARRCAAGAYSC